VSVSNHIIQSLLTDIKLQANADTRQWWMSYVHDSPPFLGVKVPQIRQSVHSWYIRENVEEFFSQWELFSLGIELLRQDYSEYKLAGIIYFQELLLPNQYVEWRRDLPQCLPLFAQKSIQDANTCDWLAAKFIGPLLRKEGAVLADELLHWTDHPTCWVVRTAIVSYVSVSSESRYYHTHIYAACKNAIKRPEPACKNAVGWLLKEIAKWDEDFVLDFINANLDYFSTEALRNAMKHFAPPVQELYAHRLPAYCT
jgi:3-methyladenine DNA glycosylase AlkD